MKSNTCIKNLLKIISILQNNSLDFSSNTSDCSKPFLGPSISTAFYNTRVINLYNKYGELILGTYKNESIDNITSFFRVQNVTDSCCTLLLLKRSNENFFQSTHCSMVINLNCIGAIKCVSDVSINL